MASELQLIKSQDSYMWLNKEQKINFHNGKIRCYICMKDIPSGYFMKENDFKSLYIYYKKAFYKSIQIQDQLVSQIDNNNIVVKNLSLIYPCLCDKAAHKDCLINLCFVNMTFQCHICKEKYKIEFLEKSKSLSTYLCNIFFAIIITIIHLILFVLSILLFMGFFEFNEKHFFWSFILGLLIAILNTIFCILSIKLVIAMNKKKVVPILDGKSEVIKKKIYDGENIYKYLTDRDKCEKLQLIEKKVNNLKFIDLISRGKNNVNKFIFKNNTIFNIKKFAGLEDPQIFANQKPIYNTHFHIFDLDKKDNLQFSLPPTDNTRKMIRSRTNIYDKSDDADRIFMKYTSSKKFSSASNYNSQLATNELENTKLSSKIHHNLIIHANKNYDLQEIKEVNELDGRETSQLYKNKTFRTMRSNSIKLNENINNFDNLLKSKNITTKEITRELIGKHSDNKISTYKVDLDNFEENMKAIKKINKRDFLPKQNKQVKYLEDENYNNIFMNNNDNFIDGDVLFEY